LVIVPKNLSLPQQVLLVLCSVQGRSQGLASDVLQRMATGVHVQEELPLSLNLVVAVLGLGKACPGYCLSAEGTLHNALKGLPLPHGGGWALHITLSVCTVPSQ